MAVTIIPQADEMEKPTERLRFAALVRVSTEKQKRKGESLNTQTTQIEQYVKTLHGNPKILWYKGQEHATPDYERKILDQLLADSGKNLFDAVIVCDPDRWSRDNMKSKAGLDILRKARIQFFVGTTEYNLLDPDDKFKLGLYAEIGELHARKQAEKSIRNRIGRAKRNIPTNGKLPYGRIYDGRRWDAEEVPKAEKKPGWDVDKAAVKRIKRAAERYLKDETIEAIAKSSGIPPSSLWRILVYKSGTKWPIRFQAEDLNIDETVTLSVPPLLNEATIKAIQDKIESNRTTKRGFGKKDYLLSHFVLCADCGYAVSGSLSHKKYRNYKHPPSYRRDRQCSHGGYTIPADLLENSVLIWLVRTFGDEEAMRKAIEAATPNLEKQNELLEEQEQLKEKQEKTNGKIRNIVRAIGNDTMTEEEAKLELAELRSKILPIQNRLSVIESEIKERPSPDKIKQLSKYAKLTAIDNARNMTPKDLLKKSYQWKRNLIEHALTGKDSEGRRLGVYVKPTGKKKQPWKFEIRGIVENILLDLPLSDIQLVEAFGLDPEHQDVPAELEKIRNTNFRSSSQREARQSMAAVLLGIEEPSLRRLVLKQP